MALDVKSRAKIYEKLDFLREGQFATVYKARDKTNDTIVAIKQIKVGHRAEAKDGINRKALREIKLLQELSHPNIIGFLDIFGHKSNISLVFDFMETDLQVLHRVVVFGARMYGVGVDMWAVGCILAELLLRLPFLTGDSGLDQLSKIFEAPTDDTWPVSFELFSGTPLEHVFSAAGNNLLERLQGLFTFNPSTRLTATQAYYL
ncbi:hypothetical protein J4Q44_G00232020 [Coregonus suidteri]|uniref:Protein kinase domain-containing protein n=1 Tax=Coregonus suidteri TaxID=861788 RepID=A0AAN8QYF9_9TELE